MQVQQTTHLGGLSTVVKCHPLCTPIELESAVLCYMKHFYIPLETHGSLASRSRTLDASLYIF